MTHCELDGKPYSEWCDACTIIHATEDMRRWLELRGLEPTS